MPLTSNYIKRLARTLYRHSVTSKNSRIQELGYYDPNGDKHLLPLSLLAS
jgi:hypothetical protein